MEEMVLEPRLPCQGLDSREVPGDLWGTLHCAQKGHMGYQGQCRLARDERCEDRSGGRLHSATRIPVPFPPLWHADYFELKATETLLAQEKLLPPLNYLEELWGLAHN